MTASRGYGKAEGLALWRRVATGEDAGAADAAAIARFAEIITPALADHLLGPGLADAEAVAQSRLVNRFNAAAQRAALLRISAAGIDHVVLKGFAFAHTLYPAPEIRTIGDLDILVRAADRDRLIALLAGEGYAFRALPRPPWGFISTASYMPFVSADGACNLDIHIHPDCWPAYRSLTTELVFAQARTVTIDGDSGGGLVFRMPCDTQALVLCATNAAKDKFGIFAARKIADALVLLRRGQPDVAAAEGLAKIGRFRLPLHVFFALLRELGAELPARWAADALPARARGEFARLLADTVGLYPAEPQPLATLRRELTVCTEPSVGLANGLRRLAGLVRPGSGIPDGARTA